MKVFNIETDVNIASYNTLRDNTLDIIAGILIIRMIMGHFMSMCDLKNTFLFDAWNVFFFYMPWFFYKSGMFCSSERKESRKYLKSNFNKFIIPYIAFAIFGLLIGFVTTLFTSETILEVVKTDVYGFVFHGSTTCNAPIWFLLSLCIVRVTYNCIRNFINSYIIISLCLIFAFLHYLFLANHGVWWIGNVCSGMLFYLCGKELKNLQYNKVILIISAIALICIGVLKPTIVTMYGNYLLYGGGIILYGIRFAWQVL